MSGITGHEKPIEGHTNDWLTPPNIIDTLGPFDLDPCASIDQPWATARVHYTETHDGLSMAWFGLVWCNPPYGAKGWPFLNRLAEHGTGIALVFARTETKGFFEQVWEKADALLFLKGRLTFCEAITGNPGAANAGAPSVLIAYGPTAEERLVAAWLRNSIEGALVMDWRSPVVD